VPSVVGIFNSAGWWEREPGSVRDLFCRQSGLASPIDRLRFRGSPVAQDFPLTGYVELRYDEDQKAVVYDPVRLQQEFRSFDFLSPWEGMDKILPGDEKATPSGGEPEGQDGR